MNGMKSRLLFFLCSCCCVTFTQAQVDRISSAREELNRGVAAFRNADYDEAIEHFNNAVHFSTGVEGRAALSGYSARAILCAGRGYGGKRLSCNPRPG